MNTLTRILQDKNKTEKWLADILHIRESCIKDYCKNKKELSLNALFLIAYVLKIEPSELYQSQVD